MARSELTDLQRQAIECLEGARSAGVALSEHVRARGLNLRAVYDAIAQLRRRGVVAPARVARRRAGGALRFARVRVAGAAPVNDNAQPLRLKLALANGRVGEIEIADLAALPSILAALERAA